MGLRDGLIVEERGGNMLPRQLQGFSRAKKELQTMAKKKVSIQLADAMAKVDEGSTEVVETLEAQAESVTLEEKAMKKGSKPAKKTAEQKQAERLTSFKLLAPPESQIDENGIAYIPLDSLVPLDSTPIPNARLAMRETNKEHAEHMLRSMERGVELPPLKVQFAIEGDTPVAIVIDGYHRWSAIEALLESVLNESGEIDSLTQKRHALKVKVVPQNFRNYDALIQAAFTANMENGLPVSTASRSRYAIWLYELETQKGTIIVTPQGRNRPYGIRDAARAADVSHVAVYKQMDRDRDMLQKMRDFTDLKGEEAEESVTLLEAEATEKAAGDFTKSMKALLNAMARVANHLDEPALIAQALQQYVTADTSADVELFAEAFRLTVEKLASGPVEPTLGTLPTQTTIS